MAILLDDAANVAAPLLPHRRPSRLSRFASNPLAMTGAILLVAVLLLVFVLPLVVRLEPVRINLAATLRPPTMLHLLGTDALGRDVLARVAYGGQITVVVALLGTALALVVGTALGTISGYFGGPFDAVAMRAVDLLMAFPSMLLAVLVTAILGVGLNVVVIAICVFMIPNFARVSRATVMSIVERDYVRAALGMGARHIFVLRQHILPNTVGPLAVQTSLNAAWAILSVAWMSFLGFGAQSPTPELGAMVSDARGVLLTAPWCSIFPGLTITLTVLALNFIGDGMRDVLDPRNG